MKNIKLLVATLVSVLSLGLSATASAATYWQLDMSNLPATVNSRSFNVSYTVLSTDASNFCIQLMQNDVPTGVPQNTTDDPDGVNGNSGNFSVTVPSDGTYTFAVKAIRGDCGASDVKVVSDTVKVDATAPGTPAYNGKTRSGNSYTVNFTAPTDSDVTAVAIYASTATSYSADNAHKVGTVAVTPGQAASFSYAAPDAGARFFSVRAFDAAGNGSRAVGDANTVVNTPSSATVASAATGNSGTAGSTAAGAGTVEGASTGNGQVSPTGAAKTSSNAASVLGTKKTAKAAAGWSTGRKVVTGIVIAAVAAAAAYYAWYRRKMAQS